MNRADRRRWAKCKHRRSRTKVFADLGYDEINCPDCNTTWKVRYPLRGKLKEQEQPYTSGGGFVGHEDLKDEAKNGTA